MEVHRPLEVLQEQEVQQTIMEKLVLLDKVDRQDINIIAHHIILMVPAAAAGMEAEEPEIIVVAVGQELREEAGGSGFVWTSSTASNVPSDYSVSTKYYLTNAFTTAGNASFESTSGGTETGHSGDGYAKITPVSVTGTSSTTTSET